MRFRTFVLIVATLLIGGLALTAASNFQRQDLASSIFPVTTVEPKAAAAANVLTGRMVDLANYAGAMLQISVGRAIDSLNNFRYIVLSDSSAGAAVALVDSVQIDSTDNAAYKLGYKGAKRWIRATVRASNVGDTSWVSVDVLRAGARFRN
jgi:hypothetical protein